VLGSRKSRLVALLSGAPLACFLTGNVSAQTQDSSGFLAEADKAIDGLRQLTKDLSEAGKRYRRDLDADIARHDRGLLPDKSRLPGADTEMNGGPSDLLQDNIRKCFAFRTLASRNGRNDPRSLADLDELQDLMREARSRVAASNSLLKRLLVVSVRDIDRQRDLQVKGRHDHLVKARTAAEEAAADAYLLLPADAGEAGPKNYRQQVAWGLIGNFPNAAQGRPVTDSTETKLEAAEPALPFHIDRHRRYALAREPSYYLALTDSGRIDERGRRLFFQEEWVQRQGAVTRMRRRVAVDPVTGDHVLIRRYPPIEMQGSIEALFGSLDRDHLWYMDPVDDETRPTCGEVESSLTDVTASREAISAAAREFGKFVRESLTRHDSRAAEDGNGALDSGLADGLRENLFAIRAHVAGVPFVLEAEGRVRQAIEDAAFHIGNLERQVAWANRIPTDDSDSAKWDRILQQSDREIDLVHRTEAQVLAYLPPDSRHTQDKFPALQKDMIVRIRRLSPWNMRAGSVRLLQEIWCMENKMQGIRAVRRTATSVLVDQLTGDQTVVGFKTKYYDVAQGVVLEEIFDEHGADELLISDRS
jgi:hypothetical protein